MYLLLPIINSPNHTGKKKSSLIPVITFILIIVLYHIYTGNALFFSGNAVKLFIPLITVLLINSFNSFHVIARNWDEAINQTVEHFNFRTINDKKSHEIYEELIEKLNSIKILFLQIENIYCFKLDMKKKKVILINGSRFVTSFEFPKKFIRDLSNFNDKTDIKEQIQVNNRLLEHSFMQAISTKRNYIYIFETKKDCSIFLYLYTKTLLSPILTKISKYLDMESEVLKERYHRVSQIKDKYTYVNFAINIMHYIRNILSPIKNYIALVNKYDNEETKEQKEIINSLIVKQRRRVEQTYKSLMQRASYLLDKTKNPFEIINIDDVALIDIISIISNYHTLIFDSSVKLILERNIRLNKIYKLDKNILEIIFADILSNAQKYGKSDVSLEIIEKKDNTTFKLSNTLKNNKNIDNIIKAYNDENRMEIAKRKTHGLMNVKELLNQLKIENYIYVKNNNFIFNLKIRGKNENTDI
jgi:signal transduction histidine kinase